MALRAMFRVSERLACRVVGQHPSTQRHATKVVDIEEAKLRRRLREIAAEHIRWGRRMAYQPLINGKEVGLLEALRVRAETKRQAAAIHAYRLLQRYGKPIRNRSDAEGFLGWLRAEGLSDCTIAEKQQRQSPGEGAD